MDEIILLVDYKSQYGIKFNAVPYRSGLDLALFQKEMAKYNFKITPTYFFAINFENPSLYCNKKILYQSSEAYDGYGEYKSFIDDVLYFLKLCGAQLIPEYKYFKGHSNKNFMEMLRIFIKDKNKPINSFYGSLEDFELDDKKREFPVVIKKSHGDQSKGVFKASSQKELNKIVSYVSKATYSVKEAFKDKARKIKHKEYQPFSIKRNKFIIQSFTPNLKGDFKIVIFNDIFFLIKRENRPGDFRASGGGYNSFTGEFDLPNDLLSYSNKIFKSFHCPYISLDIGVNKDGFHLIEFQFINFGTSAHSKSRYYFQKNGEDYLKRENGLTLEYLYSYSLNAFLK